MNILFNTVNGIGTTLGLFNMDIQYPSVIEEIFKERSFKGADLKLFPLAHNSGVSLSGFDFRIFAGSLETHMNKTLFSEPVMQCTDAWAYKGISLHIKGRESSTRMINLRGELAFKSLKGVESAIAYANSEPTHTGGAFPLNKLDIIVHIFRKFTQILVLHRDQNECFQASFSLNSIDSKSSPLEDDVTPLFEKDASISKDLLLKLFTGTHPDLQLGENPEFKLFKTA